MNRLTRTQMAIGIVLAGMAAAVLEAPRNFADHHSQEVGDFFATIFGIVFMLLDALLPKTELGWIGLGD